MGKWHKCLVLAFSWVVLLCFATNVQAQKKQKKTATADSMAISNADTLVVDSLTRVNAKTVAADTTVKRHSPKKAAIFSAVLPGLGQAYNKKYWKIPIIYGGFAGLGYAIYINAANHRTFSNAYRTLVNDSGVSSITISGQNYNAAQALDFKNYYKRNMDISIIFTAVLYALNIVDAVVDAHLFHFDISDKLTLNVQPVYQFQASGKGFGGVQLNFRL